MAPQKNLYRIDYNIGDDKEDHLHIVASSILEAMKKAEEYTVKQSIPGSLVGVRLIASIDLE